LNVSTKRKNTGIQVSSTMSSIRYSLTENITSNRVAGFSLYDVAVFSKVNLKNRQSVRIQFSIKNIFDTNYSYIRYFVMPGRNYLVTLNYAIN
jgi:outer membrane cobalamin receptor